MCAHYFAYTEKDLIEIRLIIEEWNQMIFKPVLLATDHVRPANVSPVITKDGLQPMKWGFPSPTGKGINLHARSETAAEKPMFKEAFSSRRCAISTTGFIEFGEAKDQLSLFEQPAPTKKKPKKDGYIFTLPDTPVFHMAGLYNPFTVDGVTIPHFVVMTMGANRSVIEIHDRMPVILLGNETSEWLEKGTLPGIAPLFENKKIA